MDNSEAFYMAPYFYLFIWLHQVLVAALTMVSLGVAHRLSSCRVWVLEHVGSVDCGMWYISSPTRDQTLLLFTASWILNRWLTTEVHTWLLRCLQKWRGPDVYHNDHFDYVLLDWLFLPPFLLLIPHS